ncbi:MAG: polyprenyl synthetase family protein, partial [Chloroflexi bacterium]
MDLPAPLLRHRPEIESCLRSFLDRPATPELYRMLRYHLGWEDADGQPSSASGKLLRPSLCLLACEAAGGEPRRALPAAAAVELVHNFSLVHDDIQDRDRERHHRPTVWALWGEAQGINAGDALLSLARLALLRLHDEDVEAATVLEAGRVLDERTLEMVEGQVMDLAFEQAGQITVDDCLAMMEKKTSALFDCAVYLGVLAATGDRQAAEKAGAFGRQLGLAFQIRDDLLGIWGLQTRTGKPAGADIARRKKSLPVVFGLAAGGEISDSIKSVYQQERISEDDVAQVVR